MLKSRRGLLAAGLAVAVVSALGAASILSAAAEEIPGAPDTSAAVAAAADKATPPPLLPWGAHPERISIGKPGASSSSLRAAGLDAAAPDASGSASPAPKYGPKGRSSRTSFLKSETTDITPPAPPVTAKAAAAADEVDYLYNVGREYAVHDGLYGNLTIAKPELDTSDYHTLAELALQSADGNQIVEVGWNVDRVVNNGDDDPHLFVYHWVNRQSSCYNGCGFVSYSNASGITAGATLSYGVAKYFGIKYYQGNWWVAFDSEWVGYFPGTLWSSAGITFTQSGLMQAFGEVAATSTTPCTDMGDGQPATATTGAKMASVYYVDAVSSTETKLTEAKLTIQSTTDVYKVYIYPTSQRTFRYGGPGAC